MGVAPRRVKRENASLPVDVQQFTKLTVARDPSGFFRRFNSQSDRPEFLRDFWSGPILASDDIREHMGEAKNGPDHRLS